MRNFLGALLLFAICVSLPAPARAQAAFGGVDLLYPELAHPEEDARAAIKKGDLRFVAIDRYGKDTPGVNRYPQFKRRYGTRFVKQPFRIIATPSQNFSFRIRARAYAETYNAILLRHLLTRTR